MRLEHHIKLTNIAPFSLATSWTLYVQSLEFFRRNTLRNAVCNLICTEAPMTCAAFYKRIRKSCCMTRCYPCAWVHNNCRINAIHIFTVFYPVFPPGIHNFLFQRYTEWTKIPRTGHPAIDVTTLPNKAATLTKANNIFHFCHNYLLLYLIFPLISALRVTRKLGPKATTKTAKNYHIVTK